MKVQELSSEGPRSLVMVLDRGEEAVEALLSLARDHDVKAGRFTGLGAFQDVTLGFFDPEQKDYEKIQIDEQVEVVALVGNFATKDGEAKVHPHVVVSKRDGRAYGGHLLAGHVRPTLEIIVTDEPAHLHRQTDPETGLPLLALRD